jgi:hypothetical protein
MTPLPHWLSTVLYVAIGLAAAVPLALLFYEVTKLFRPKPPPAPHVEPCFSFQPTINELDHQIESVRSASASAKQKSGAGT